MAHADVNPASIGPGGLGNLDPAFLHCRCRYCTCGRVPDVIVLPRVGLLDQQQKVFTMAMEGNM